MGRLSILRFLREQWTAIPPASVETFNNTVLVTGATTGLGLEAARQLRRISGTSLVLTGRDTVKIDSAKKVIDAVANDSQQVSVEWTPLELSSFASVRAFADRVGDRKLDVFLANAGIATRKYVQTEDGWESTLQVNYLSDALLSILLLPNLVKASSPESASRLLIVSSDAHYQITELQGLGDTSEIIKAASERSYCTPTIMRQRYMLSKLLTVAFARELSIRLPSPTPVSVSAINPGLCHSNITRESESSFPGSIFVPLFRAMIGRSTEVGATTLVRAVTDPDERSRHGHYISNCEVAEESDILMGPKGLELSRTIWDETITILETVDPRVKDIMSEFTIAPPAL